MSGFKAGEHLRVFRGVYFHHGLSIGDGLVIHYASDRSGDDDCRVRCVSLKEFAQGVSVDVLACVRACTLGGSCPVAPG